MRVLGFDVSSTTIGWGVVDIDSENNLKFVDCGFIKPKKSSNIIDRIVSTRQKVIDIMDKYKPDIIGIEDIIKFMKKSTATTVVILTTFNRMVCLAAYDFLKKEPKLYNVMSIRHGLKKTKILPKKEEMAELVADHLNIQFPYIYNKNKKQIVENEDVADGLAVAIFTAKKNS